MKDIANKTGLGLATISKYLNGGSVREKNRLAIEKAIAELDFTVNEFARSLKTSKSKTIGVLIPELSNVFITSVITVLEDILRQNGYGIIVCDSRTDEERQKDAIEFLLSKMVDGIVMMPVGNDSKCLKPALDKKLPVVLVDRTIPSLENQVGEVMVDSRGIARECTRRVEKYLVLFRKRPQKNRDDRRPPGDFYLTGTSLRLPKRIGKGRGSL